MAGQYTKETTVSVEKSRAELESLLRRYGGTGFAYAIQDPLPGLPGQAMIGFKIRAEGDRIVAVRMTLPLPNPGDERFTHVTMRYTTKRRSTEAAAKAWEQECRSLWRALVLVVKAKLEACAVGISTIEREFLPDIVLPNGRTVLQELGDDLPKLLDRGEGRLMLPGSM